MEELQHLQTAATVIAAGNENHCRKRKSSYLLLENVILNQREVSKGDPESDKRCASLDLRIYFSVTDALLVTALLCFQSCIPAALLVTALLCSAFNPDSYDPGQ